MTEIDLLAIERGHVSSPAGYGKTQLIADTLANHEVLKPVLVLTHTNAGVAALRARLKRADVPSRSYVLRTLDGWALLLLSAYPNRGCINPEHLRLANPGRDYPAIQRQARYLIESGHINDILFASYSCILVDEYQDCSRDQHAMVVGCAALLPTVVLGDELQSVFGFAGPRVAWEDVRKVFPEGYELKTPRRWVNAGTPHIGEWLADVRRKLWAGQPIDLTVLPDGVEYHRLP